MPTASFSEAPQQSNPLASKNFGLSQSRFDQMVQELHLGDESIFQTIFLAHFEECMKFLRSNYRLNHTEAYDASMDALLLFRKKLVEGKIQYGNMRFLLTRMAYQLHLKSLKKQDQIRQISAEDWLLDQEEETYDEETMEALNKAWQQMCGDCSGILKGFYYDKTTLQEMAANMDVKAASLRKRKQRCMEKLRNYFTQFYTI